MDPIGPRAVVGEGAFSHESEQPLIRDATEPQVDSKLSWARLNDAAGAQSASPWVIALIDGNRIRGRPANTHPIRRSIVSCPTPGSTVPRRYAVPKGSTLGAAPESASLATPDGGSRTARHAEHLRQLQLFCPYSWHISPFDNLPVSTRRWTSANIFIAAYTPRASLSVGDNHGFVVIIRTGTPAQLCSALSTGGIPRRVLQCQKATAPFATPDQTVTT